MQSLEDLFSHSKALVFGIGGGGDVVGALPTARLLELHGVEAFLGGIAWERAPHDSQVGPRSLDEVREAEHLNGVIALAGPETRTVDGLEFTETRVARHQEEDIFLIDVTKGPRAVTQGLEEVCSERGIDLIIGVDSGGDVLAKGSEEGLESPIADAYGLVVLESLSVDSCLGVFGYGSDGELTHEELNDGVCRAAEKGGLLGAWGLTPDTVNEMEELVDAVGTTESSKIPLEASRGGFGKKPIRDGDRTVNLTPLSTVTLYFDAGSVAETSLVTEKVRSSGSIMDSHRALSQLGLTTEIDVERRKLR